MKYNTDKIMETLGHVEEYFNATIGIIQTVLTQINKLRSQKVFDSDEIKNFFNNISTAKEQACKRMKEFSILEFKEDSLPYKI